MLAEISSTQIWFRYTICKICIICNADHRGFLQETSDSGAYCRCPMTPRDCSQSFPSISSEYASSHSGITSLPLQSRTHSPESASCSFLHHESNQNPMISPHILMDIQKAFCKIVKKTYIVQLIYTYGLCIYILCIYYIQSYIVHILHIYWFKYSRLDSDPDAVWEMIYPHRTDEPKGHCAYQRAGIPEILFQNWHDQMLVSLVSAPTPAFRSEIKTFQPVQVSQPDGPLHQLDQPSTTWVVDHYPFLQDIIFSGSDKPSPNHMYIRHLHAKRSREFRYQAAWRTVQPLTK